MALHWVFFCLGNGNRLLKDTAMSSRDKLVAVIAALFVLALIVWLLRERLRTIAINFRGFRGRIDASDAKPSRPDISLQDVRSRSGGLNVLNRGSGGIAAKGAESDDDMNFTNEPRGPKHSSSTIVTVAVPG